MNLKDIKIGQRLKSEKGTIVWEVERLTTDKVRLINTQDPERGGIWVEPSQMEKLVKVFNPNQEK